MTPEKERSNEEDSKLDALTKVAFIAGALAFLLLLVHLYILLSAIAISSAPVSQHHKAAMLKLRKDKKLGRETIVRVSERGYEIKQNGKWCKI